MRSLFYQTIIRKRNIKTISVQSLLSDITLKMVTYDALLYLESSFKFVVLQLICRMNHIKMMQMSTAMPLINPQNFVSSNILSVKTGRRHKPKVSNVQGGISRAGTSQVLVSNVVLFCFFMLLFVLFYHGLYAGICFFVKHSKLILSFGRSASLKSLNLFILY